MIPFSVGITGHRASGTLNPNKVGEITARIRQVMAAVEASFGRENDRHLRLVSPLADGVDQIAARIAVDMGWDLIVPLPCHAAQYGKEFDTAAAKEFDALLNCGRATAITMDHLIRLPTLEEPKGAWNKSAFEATGRMMLGLSDLLIAVWDGQRERGPGGTGQIVREADEAQIPIVWINATNPESVGLLKPGSSAMLALSQAVAGVASGGSTPSLETDIAAVIESIVAKPAPVQSGKVTIDLCSDFVSERVDADLQVEEEFFLTFYQRFYNWVSPPQTHGASHLAVTTHPVVLKPWVEVGNEYDRADQLAIRFASLYRSSFLANYILGALAVTLAMVGGVLFLEKMVWSKIVCGVLELLVLVMLVTNWRKSINQLWHEKFTDYRLLAEHLRHLQFLLPLGMVPFTRAAAHDPEHPRQHWVNWYLRKVARSATPISVDYSDVAYRREMLALLRDAWVHQQLDYQERVHERSEFAEKRLLTLAFGLLFATIAACTVHVLLEAMHGFELHLIPEALGDWTSRVLVMLAAALPAWATAVHSIAQRAELVRLNKRSGAMVGALRSLKTRFDDLSKKEAAGTLATHELASLARETAGAMLQEAFDWRIQYRMGDFAP